MEKFRKSLALLFALVMVLTIIPIGVINASALSFSDYKTKYTAFINDARWQNGISWGYYQAPKLSSWGSKGCCAYAADFEYYMYGTKGWAGTAFTSAESITSGSILYINIPSGGEHWLVVLERDGSTLYTAEGNFNSGVHITNTFYRVYNGYLQQNGYYNSSNQWVNSWANCTLVYGYNYNITDHNLTDFSFSYPDSIFSNQEITVSWNYSYPTANFWLCVLNEDDSVYKRFEDLGTDTSCSVGTLEKGTYRFHLEWYEGDTLCIKQSEFFTVSDFAASTTNNDSVKASDKIQIYSQWNYDAFGSVDNSWICGSGCGLLTIGHALQWLGVIGRDQESPNATICNIFVESGYAGTVLWSERNNTLNFIASKYPGFSFEYNTDLRSIINNGGVALINKYGHQYLAVDISSDSNYVHIVDSCLTVPNQNNVAVYSYNSNTGIFDQTSVANCAARNDIRWYCADPYTNKMVKANNSNPLYAGGEYWVKYSEVSGSTQIGLYSTHTHSYSAWQTVTAATCTADGSQKRVCSCGDTQTETIPALGHDLTLTPAKAATATASGNNAYYTCSRCEKVFKDAAGTVETTVAAETLAPVSGAYLKIDSKTARAGETVTLLFTLENTDALKSISISGITYDPGTLELVSGEWKLSDSTISVWDAARQNAAITFANNRDVNGEIFALTFAVKDDAADGVYAVGCTVTAKAKTASGEQSVNIAAVSGSVEVVSVLLGDVDGDNQVTSDDAIQVLFYTLLPDMYPVNQDVDFDGDGEVTSDDAIYLLFYTLLPDLYPLQ